MNSIAVKVPAGLIGTLEDRDVFAASEFADITFTVKGNRATVTGPQDTMAELGDYIDGLADLVASRIITAGEIGYGHAKLMELAARFPAKPDTMSTPAPIEAREVTVAVCEYSAAHKATGVEAETVIDCGPVGQVPACEKCADFYAKRSTDRGSAKTAQGAAERYLAYSGAYSLHYTTAKPGTPERRVKAVCGQSTRRAYLTVIKPEDDAKWLSDPKAKRCRKCFG